ncbi:cilia- and flagella-associated protein 52-like isoform X2 [Alligator sinensis]|uniref:Cilia- and flagella-associated protein 52 n=1 Tax=Alligator sinensis TaxID=38654 RepID=A0A3Q0HAH1_ALLSI|nr:cilia- and flagella-associated protein 52-like isoform X2 [Alligator sinensis]
MAAPQQDAEPEAQELELELELQAVIGFNGYIYAGLTCHPDREHLIYPLGCTVVIESLNNSQSFLHGHTNNVSCVAVSPSGRYIASGQVTFMGFKADMILWDYEKKELLARLSLHKGKVEKLAFSPNDLYLVSLGGQDDGNVVVWSIAKRDAICGSPASAQSAGNAAVLAFSRCRDEMFVSAGNGTIRVWELDLPNRKIRSTECQTGQLKRVITCIMMADDDSYFYVGTTSGDILKLNTKSKLMSDYGPMKDKFSLGVTALLLLKTGDLVVGTGGGIIALFKGSNYKSIKGTSDLFATCSKSDIRVWHTPENRELLRITIPNMTCHAIEFMRDGKSIISAWNDGKIRAFTPETGRLMYVIDNAHSLGVTAIAATSDCKRIISGGGEGQVRVWEIGQNTRKLEGVLKEHISAVSCIKIKKNNLECITASLDGTCIIWDLVRLIRNQMILANTLFQCVCYHPEEFQIITSGTDRNIGWWEVFDGSVIRELEGSVKGSINGMDITSDGTHFVTGGDDHLVKVWDYDTGEVTHVGVGHSGSIRRLKICPGNKYIVSVSADGAILRWKYPHSH